MKSTLELIWYFLKRIWNFFEKYGITIITICMVIICVVTLILDFIIFSKKLKETKNLSYSKIKEEVLHELSSYTSETHDNDNGEEDSADDVPI